MDTLPTLMNAIILEKAGAPILKQVPVPTPMEGQILIRVDSSPLNPSDLLFISGQYFPNMAFPQQVGFEGAGVVVSQGELFGKRVSFRSDYNSGAYAEYAVAKAAYCCPVKDDVDLRIASTAFINPVTVVGMLDVVKQANVTAVVHTAAASQLGRMMVRYFNDNGVKVINVVRRQEQADLLKAEGAEYILNQTDADFSAKLTALSTELKATICFDAIGGDFTGKILAAMPRTSTIYNYGCLDEKSVIEISAMDLIFNDKTLKAFTVYAWLDEKPSRLLDAQLKIQKLNDGAFSSVIAKEFTLEQFDEAITFYKANMSAGKTLIRPTQSK